jgi:hypothetical protein
MRHVAATRVLARHSYKQIAASTHTQPCARDAPPLITRYMLSGVVVDVPLLAVGSVVVSVGLHLSL